MDIAVARILLPQLHIAFHTFGLPLHSHLLRIHGPGLEKTRSCQRSVARHQKNLPLPPMGRQRIRPCAVGTGPYPAIHFTPRRIAAAPSGHCGAPRRPCGLVNCAVGTGPYPAIHFTPRRIAATPSGHCGAPRRPCGLVNCAVGTGPYPAIHFTPRRIAAAPHKKRYSREKIAAVPFLIRWLFTGNYNSLYCSTTFIT